MDRTRPVTDTKRVEVVASQERRRLTVYSDVICPWCYVGKRNLDAALEVLAAEIAVDVRWRAFQLNPSMPPEGLERRVYRSQKFGSWKASQRLDAEVTQVGHAVGIAFIHDGVKRTPSTRLAHRLSWKAEQEGRQSEIVERLFRAYFTEGRNIGDPGVLAELGREAGIRGDLAQWLQSEAGDLEVRRDQHSAERLGIRGVPAVVYGGQALFSGALPAAAITEQVRRAIGERS